MEASKIRTLLFFIASIFLFSCEQKEEDRLSLIASQTACNEKWAEIEKTTEQLEGIVAKGGNRKADLNILRESKRIAKWKRFAVDNLSVNGLKNYVDSVLYLSNDSTISFWLSNLESIQMNTDQDFNLVQQNLKSLPATLQTAEDSTKFYQILYFSLRKELQIHMGLSSRMDDFLSCQIRRSKIKYQLGDTVKVVIPLSRYEVNNLKFQPQLVTLFFSPILANLNQQPSSRVLQTELIGGLILFKFRVLKPGYYRLKGPVFVRYPESGEKKVIKNIDLLFEVQ